VRSTGSQVADALIADGIRPQTRVAYLDRSNDQFVELHFGVGQGVSPRRKENAGRAIKKEDDYKATTGADSGNS
jgi:hypothetical protein